MADKKNSKMEGMHKFLLVLAVLVAYSVFALHKFGIQNGLLVTWLTWAFFVFGTPIADAGFLVAFPIRVITGFKMLYTQIAVWIVAGIFTALITAVDSKAYDKTPILQLFHKVITTPWPLWSIFILSFIGTFVSVKLDDDVYDVAVSKNKKESLSQSKRVLYSRVAGIAVTFVLYFAILRFTDTHISVF